MNRYWRCLLIPSVVSVALLASDQMKSHPLPAEVVMAIARDYYDGNIPQKLKGTIWNWSHRVVDLNGDGTVDFVIAREDPDFCGSGGCGLLIYASSPYGYRSVYSGGNFYSEFSASKNTTNGFSDLVFNTSSATESYLHLLKYNGHEYEEVRHH